jgi:ferrous iron transport protein A
MTKNLSELHQDVPATILQIKEGCQKEFALRLLSLGFTPGTPIKVIFCAPITANPLAVEVRGAVLAIRREEAAWIEVDC